jgi:SAM-dependent methyltransferase
MGVLDGVSTLMRRIGIIPARGTGLVVRLRAWIARLSGRRVSSQDYWTFHNVTLHRTFASPEESLAYLRWRNDIYVGASRLLPTGGVDGKVVLDYGCGPGNDLLGFATDSRPRRLIGMDVSPTSLREAHARLELHGILAREGSAVELSRIWENDPRIPLADQSIDYIHCSGVLHHIQDPIPTLREFRRVLRPAGECRIMVYNYFSVFTHLHVAYLHRILDSRYRGMSFDECFRASTDGFDCPVSRPYRPEEWRSICRSVGFDSLHVGNAVFTYELSILPRRFEAILNRELPAEHRNFLLDLTFDERGLPYYRQQPAGIAGCYQLRYRHCTSAEAKAACPN